MNLNFPFYKRQQEYQSHKWNTHSHTRRQNCHKSCERITNMESQTNTSPTQTVLKGRKTSEPIGKNAQIALHTHKWSSMADRHQNQLAKCPRSTSCSKEKFARVHTGGLTLSWSSSAHPDACFHSTEEKLKLTTGAEQGRNREDPQNKWFRQLLGTSPKIPFSGPGSHKQQAYHNHPSALSWPWLYSGKPRGARCHKSAGTTPCWMPKTVTKSGVQPLTTQKTIKRPGWWKGKFALFWMLASRRGRADTCQKANSLPHPRQSGARAFIDRGRGLHAEMVPSALTVILKLVIGGLTSIILIVLSTVNLQFQGQFVPISLRPVLGIVAA